MNRLALRLADLLIRFVGRGLHTGAYMDRIHDVRSAIREIKTIYYGKDRR